MKAVFVIDVDKDELGKAFAEIMAEENGINFFARGVIRPLPTDMTGAYANSLAEDYISFTEGWDSYEKALMGGTE